MGHVVDKLGKILWIGDTVAFSEGWTSKLLIGKVHAFTEKMVVIERDNMYFKNHPNLIVLIKD
jgi:hypothetical protein